MPRVHLVKRARKSYGDIHKGTPYYWWKFRHGSKQRSKTPPLASQLTQSPFWSTLFGIQESLTSFSGSSDPEEVENHIDDLKGELEELRDETQEKVDNAPESLAESEQTQMMTSRVEALDDVINTLDGIDTTDEGAWDEAHQAVGDISCD